MNNLVRNNHFVPQLYLKAWKNEEEKIWTYNLLVPNEKCEIWQENSTKSIASQRDFYTLLEGKVEVDEIEQYLNNKFENPAKVPLDKAVRGKSLSEDDCKCLIDFIGCQIVRTPFFAEKMLELLKERYSSIVLEIGQELRNMTKEDMINYSQSKEYNNYSRKDSSKNY